MVIGFTFVTDVGELDVLGSPPGTKGFDDLAERSSTYDLGDGSTCSWSTSTISCS